MKIRVLVTKTETREVWLQTNGELPTLGGTHVIDPSSSLDLIRDRACDIWDDYKEGPIKMEAQTITIVK